MGRHRDEEAAVASGAEGSGLVVLGVIAILALVLVGFGVRGLFFTGDAAANDDGGANTSETAGGDSDDAEPSAIPDMGGGSEDESDAEGSADEAEPSDEPQDAAAEESAEDAAVDPDEPEALQLCHAEVAAGDAYAAATATSATNWKTHYSASVQYNEGEISLEEAEEQFAESKRTGPADIEATTSTKSAYDEAQGACDSLDTDELAQEWAEEASQCRERSQVLRDVADTGSAVNSDWAEHIEMMDNKDDTDPAEYYDRWRSMVRAAPDAMEPYEASAEALQEAPVCA